MAPLQEMQTAMRVVMRIHPTTRHRKIYDKIRRYRGLRRIAVLHRCQASRTLSLHHHLKRTWYRLSSDALPVSYWESTKGIYVTHSHSQRRRKNYASTMTSWRNMSPCHHPRRRPDPFRRPLARHFYTPTPTSTTAGIARASTIYPYAGTPRRETLSGIMTILRLLG